MDTPQAIVLGLVQGITEFLPTHSTRVFVLDRVVVSALVLAPATTEPIS